MKKFKLPPAMSIRKRANTYCRYHVIAIGYDKSGNIVKIGVNHPRLNKKGGSIHAERDLIKKSGKALRKIRDVLIIRIGRGKLYKLLAIEPCEVCKKMLEKYKIKWHTIT